MTLSAQDNEKLFLQLQTGFKRTVNWNKHQSESTLQTPNQYWNYLFEASFQGVNRFLVLSFEKDAHWRSHKRYFLATVEITDYSVMIDRKILFHLLVKKENDLITYEIFVKIATGQENDYRSACFLDYNYFKNYYKMIATDLSKY